jgi:hypothetical protein
MAEFHGSAVGAEGCAYARLGAYNNNYFGRSVIGAPVISQTRSNEIIVVPSFGGPGYNNLVASKNPNCSGYSKLKNAYPISGGCGVYTSRMCG